MLDVLFEENVITIELSNTAPPPPTGHAGVWCRGRQQSSEHCHPQAQLQPTRQAPAHPAGQLHLCRPHPLHHRQAEAGERPNSGPTHEDAEDSRQVDRKSSRHQSSRLWSKGFMWFLQDSRVTLKAA